jgi:hypothetical protein
VLGIRRRGRQCEDELGAPHDTRGVEQCIDDSAHVLNLPFENIARPLTLRAIAMGLHHVDGAARAACSGWRSSCDHEALHVFSPGSSRRHPESP